MSGGDPTVVLVLGVGGDVSQGILKALELSATPIRVVAACIDARSAGLFMADRALLSPRADDEAFLPWLERTIREEEVNVIMSGVEEVLDVLADAAPALRVRHGAVAIVAGPAIVARGRDKLQTCVWLREAGLPHPLFADVADADGVQKLVRACGFPLVAKPRRGKSATGVALVTDEQDLERETARDGYLLQEHLGTPEEEFTAGCFCDDHGELRGTIVLRRRLLAGTTVRAEAGSFPAIREVAQRVVSELGPVGPCNVQLRLRDGEPVPFELNVRFSGTTPIRARLGFNEVDAALRHLALGETVPPLPLVTEGIALRYWNELYVSPQAVEQLERTGRLADPERRLTAGEDRGIVT